MTDLFDYSVTAATALRLITKFGAAAKLARRVNVKYDPTTSKAVETGKLELCKAIMLQFAPYVVASSEGMIKQEDQRLLVAPQGLGGPPKPNDVFTFGDSSYTVVDVKTLAPSGTPVLHDCQVRR